MINYQGEGFFLASTVQTNAFKFIMQNNTIYLSGKDGAYSWCTVATTSYEPTSSYSISNNIFCKPMTTADNRRTILVPAGGGTVTCKNNLFVDYPNALIAPVAGWDTTNMWVSSVNYFKDAANGNFSLTANFPYKGTDNNFLVPKIGDEVFAVIRFRSGNENFSTKRDHSIGFGQNNACCRTVYQQRNTDNCGKHSFQYGHNRHKNSCKRGLYTEG